MKTRLLLILSAAMQKFDAVRQIEWAIVVISIINGIYLLSPLYKYSQSINGKTAFATALGNSLFTDIFGILLLVGAAIIIYGLVKKRPDIRAKGLFLHFITRLYNISLTIIFAGFLPFTWLSGLGIMIIAIILWTEERKRVHAEP